MGGQGRGVGVAGRALLENYLEAFAGRAIGASNGVAWSMEFLG